MLLPTLLPFGRFALAKSPSRCRNAAAPHDAISRANSVPDLHWRDRKAAVCPTGVRAVATTLQHWATSVLQGAPGRPDGDDPGRSTQVLAGLSHDLLTPLTRMKLRAETLSAQPIKQKFFSDLDELEGLIRDVLSYAGSASRPEEGCVELRLVPFLNNLALDYQDMGKAVVAANPAADIILTRPRVLRRILTNLVDNALKFAGSAEIVTEMRTDSCVTVAVLDRGPGIPDRQLTAVIRPFFRLSPIAQKPGLGLGLAIANNLARSLGGALALRNRGGGGLRAEIQLPAKFPHGHGRHAKAFNLAPTGLAPAPNSGGCIAERRTTLAGLPRLAVAFGPFVLVAAAACWLLCVQPYLR